MEAVPENLDNPLDILLKKAINESSSAEEIPETAILKDSPEDRAENLIPYLLEKLGVLVPHEPNIDPEAVDNFKASAHNVLEAENVSPETASEIAETLLTNR
ncbi:hypothetical protein COB52_02905 [Candidatus Kaiserbacteria bacterium]|nr:MAG: hypothetical protein COB52_02905 [Candidatus Kaiserbacteria bacterium]